MWCSQSWHLYQVLLKMRLLRYSSLSKIIPLVPDTISYRDKLSTAPRPHLNAHNTQQRDKQQVTTKTKPVKKRREGLPAVGLGCPAADALAEVSQYCGSEDLRLWGPSLLLLFLPRSAEAAVRPEEAPVPRAVPQILEVRWAACACPQEPQLGLLGFWVWAAEVQGPRDWGLCRGPRGRTGFRGPRPPASRRQWGAGPQPGPLRLGSQAQASPEELAGVAGALEPPLTSGNENCFLWLCF